MNLVEYEYEEMNIPTVDYDAEFSLSSKLISDIFSQLNNFGTDIVIKCSQEDISLTTNGSTGEMKVDIPMDDLNSYSIIEDEEITLTYSLAYINKMCITNKLSTDVEFSLSNECPMKISYNLGEDSLLVFFIAPKMNDE
jgi:proliferating cell nuclear antigen PCNA